MANQQLAKELHKPTFKKFEKRTYNVCGTDLADMQLNKFNRGFRFLLCVI